MSKDRLHWTSDDHSPCDEKMAPSLRASEAAIDISKGSKSSTWDEQAKHLRGAITSWSENTKPKQNAACENDTEEE